MPAPRFEGKDTPKIALSVADGAPGATQPGTPSNPPADSARRIKQLGVDWVLSGGGPIPWDEARLKDQMDRLKTSGLNLGNLMIGGFNKAIYGRPGRHGQVEKGIASILAAGKVGLPVIQYYWYAHRAMEGYFEETDDVRTGVGWTGFDYDLVRTPGRPCGGGPTAG